MRREKVPVVKRISHEFAELEVQVRFLAGALMKAVEIGREANIGFVARVC